MWRVGVACLALGSSCRFDLDRVEEHGDDGPTSDARADALGVTDAPADVFVLGAWTTPMPIGVLGYDDPSLTDDLVELYLNNDPGGDRDVLVSAKTSVGQAWPTPQVVPLVSTSEDETMPEVSWDGLTLFFARAPYDIDPHDIWVSTRPDRGSAWGAPAAVDELNSTEFDGPGTLTADGLTIFFFSDRLSPGDQDLYVATRADRASLWRTPARIDEVTTTATEVDPCPTAAGDQLFFARGLPHDLYVTRWNGSTWGAAEAIVELNTANDERDPWVTPDGRTMYFISDRDGAGSYQIYVTTR